MRYQFVGVAIRIHSEKLYKTFDEARQGLIDWLIERHIPYTENGSQVCQHNGRAGDYVLGKVRWVPNSPLEDCVLDEKLSVNNIAIRLEGFGQTDIANKLYEVHSMLEKLSTELHEADDR